MKTLRERREEGRRTAFLVIPPHWCEVLERIADENGWDVSSMVDMILRVGVVEMGYAPPAWGPKAKDAEGG